MGEGEGWGGVLIVPHDHISHELSSEANHGFEGYSDRERADYGKIIDTSSTTSIFFLAQLL